jgi:tight adherence protein B
LLREHDLGTPLDRALENVSARVGSPVVSAALSTLRIARSAGGDFVQTLEQSAAALREMARLEGVVRTKTAEGRAQTVVVSALPLPTLYLIDQLSPTLLEPLWSTDLGHVLMAIALLMWLVAFLAARRITQVDI